MVKVDFLKDLQKVLKKYDAEIVLSFDNYEYFSELDYFINVKSDNTEWIYAEGTFDQVTINSKKIQSLIKYVIQEGLHEKKD